MENMFKSIFRMFVTSAEALTMFMTIIHSLCRAGVERTVVVEKKSIAAAAISELRNANDVAITLKEVSDQATGISTEDFNKARAFLDAYQAKRQAEITGVPIRNTAPVEPEDKPKK